MGFDRAIIIVSACVVSIAACLQSSEARASCPGVYSGLTCHPSGTAPSFNICNAASTHIDCNPVGTGTNGMLIYAVYNGTDGQYDIYGTDNYGNDFCCPESTSGITDVNINGTELTDYILLDDPGAGMKLTAPSTTDVNGTVHGLGADDSITGSSATTNLYHDHLYGDNGVDTIDAGTGRDAVHGGANGDFLYGGDFDDTMDGDGGGDEMKGQEGTDTMHGEDGNDVMNGDAGAGDTLYGDSEDDIVCDTSGGTSSCNGGTGTDQLWCTAASDTQTCGGQALDACIHGGGTITGCPGTALVSDPGCP